MPESPNERRVWLSADELELFLDTARDHSTKHYIAMGLMGLCGLRRAEALAVTPSHVVDTDVQTMIRLEAGDTKADYYRSTPVPERLESSLRTYVEFSDRLGGWHDERPFIDVSGRTTARWAKKHAQRCNDETSESDDGWEYFTPHDLRRAWANRMIEDGVAPPLIMNFGGWESWPQFRDSYLNGYSSKRVREELEPLDWM